MNFQWIFGFFVVVLLCLCHSAPVDKKDSNPSAKSAFGPAFDEIVVESSLTVKRKPGNRIARNKQPGIVTEDKKVIKRQVKTKVRKRPTLPFGSFASSAAQAQAQSSKFNGSFGSFGSSSSGSFSQGVSNGPKGPVVSAAVSGTQQYKFNGYTIDISFGDAFAGANKNSATTNGASISLTGPNGKTRPLTG